MLDITLSAAETPDGLWVLRFAYSTELFDRATIERMADQFRRLAEGTIADPDRHLWELPLLSDADRSHLLNATLGARAPVRNSLCLHELVEEQAARTPDAVAVEGEGRRLSYRELNGRANRLAHYLRSLGVGPELPVAVHAERSLGALVALLAVLKAGGAYVPLDPSHPPDRLAHILADTGTPLVLTWQQHLATRRRAGHSRSAWTWTRRHGRRTARRT